MKKLTFYDGLYLNSKGETVTLPENLPTMVVNGCCFVCDDETELAKLSATLQASLSQAAQYLAANLEFYE